MSIVFRYLARQALVSMLAVSGILLLVFMSGRFIKYLADAAAGELAGDVLFQIMAYRFPGFLELILPLGFFIGILLAYGRMYLESEMTVLYACGVSDKQLLGKTLLASLPVMLTVGAMSLYVSPWGMKQVEQIFNEQRQATEFELLAPGRFQELSSGGRVTYTEALSKDKRRLEGVFIAEYDEGGQGVSIITARQGSQLIDDETGSRFLVLEDGARFEGVPGKLDYDVVGFDAYGLRIRSGNAADREWEEGLSTQSLMMSNDPKHRATLHWRFTLPLIVPIVTLLAVRLSRVNPRQGRFFHLLPAMLVYITYLGLLIVARDALEAGKVPEWIGLLWVHALFLVFGLWLQFGPAWLYRRRLSREGRGAMRKIDRYVMGTVGGATLLVMVVVLSLDFIFAFIAELEDTGNNYQAVDALIYVLLTLPRRIYDYLPLGAFMGCLIGLGSMASSSELTVIRAAGVSLKRIVWSAMKPALVVVLLGIVIGEYVAPPSERMAQSQKAVARGAGQNVASASGFWHREGDTFMHLNAVQPNGVLHGVSLFEFDANRWLVSASFAERGIYLGDHWTLENVTTTKFSDTATSQEKQHSLRWESGLSPEVLSVLIVDPEDLSIEGLFTYASYLGEQGLNAANYWLAFWKKVLMPLGTAVMVIVAISFIFGPLRSVTMGFRVFTGLIVGLLFKYAQDLLGPMSVVFGFNPVIAILLPIAVSAVAGIILLRRAG